MAVVMRPREHISLAIYRDRLLRELAARGVSLVRFADTGPVPRDCDVIWEPGLGMRPPPRVLEDAPRPVVATVHGLRAFSVPIEELFPSPAQQEVERRLRDCVLRGWWSMAPRVAAVLAASRFVAGQVGSVLGVAPERVHVSHLGVDHDVFRPDGPRARLAQSYFLHVSTGEPGRKNTERVIKAHDQLRADDTVTLALRHPDHPGGDDIVVLSGWLEEAALASWYRGALGLVFPSLYEGFGLPIVEAMACGCPVVTSTGSACEEVAGGAALLVDPRSIDAIAVAMRRLRRERRLRWWLRARGCARAARLSWDRTARRHLAVLRAAARD